MGWEETCSLDARDLSDVRYSISIRSSAGVRDPVDRRTGWQASRGRPAWWDLGGLFFPEFFNTLKVDANLVFGEWAELAAQVRERTLDVLAVGAGVPFPSFIELEAKEKVRYIAFDRDQISSLRLAMPELTPSRIPAGAYPSLLRPYETLGLYNFAIAHAELPDDLVYNVVRAVFENHEEMLEATAAAAATVPANLDRNSFLPLHPGAIRYYRQIGKAGQGD